MYRDIIYLAKECVLYVHYSMDRDAIYLPLRGLYYMYIILKNT